MAIDAAFSALQLDLAGQTAADAIIPLFTAGATSAVAATSTETAPPPTAGANCGHGSLSPEFYYVLSW